MHMLESASGRGSAGAGDNGIEGETARVGTAKGFNSLKAELREVEADMGGAEGKGEDMVETSLRDGEGRGLPQDDMELERCIMWPWAGKGDRLSPKLTLTTGEALWGVRGILPQGCMSPKMAVASGEKTSSPCSGSATSFMTARSVSVRYRACG
jgi:hypothetical protein